MCLEVTGSDSDGAFGRGTCRDVMAGRGTTSDQMRLDGDVGDIP